MALFSERFDRSVCKKVGIFSIPFVGVWTTQLDAGENYRRIKKKKKKKKKEKVGVQGRPACGARRSGGPSGVGCEAWAGKCLRSRSAQVNFRTNPSTYSLYQ